MRVGISFGVLILLVGLGCSPVPQMNYAAAHLVKAGGTVTLDGKPLLNAVVTLEDAVNGTTSNGVTDDRGVYRLMFDSQMAGVTPGKKIVRISTTKKILGLNATDEGGDAPAGGERPKELVPNKFNRQSELTVEVTSNKTTYDFDLKSP